MLQELKLNKLLMKLMLILAQFLHSTLYHFLRLLKEHFSHQTQLLDIQLTNKENFMEAIFTIKLQLINGLMFQHVILKLLLLLLLQQEMEDKLILLKFQKMFINSSKFQKIISQPENSQLDKNYLLLILPLLQDYQLYSQPYQVKNKEMLTKILLTGI